MLRPALIFLLRYITWSFCIGLLETCLMGNRATVSSWALDSKDWPWIHSFWLVGQASSGKFDSKEHLAFMVLLTLEVILKMCQKWVYLSAWVVSNFNSASWVRQIVLLILNMLVCLAVSITAVPYLYHHSLIHCPHPPPQGLSYFLDVSTDRETGFLCIQC